MEPGPCRGGNGHCLAGFFQDLNRARLSAAFETSWPFTLTVRSNMTNSPVSIKDGEQRPEDKPTAEGSAHKPAKHVEETARLASSVEPNKNPENVRIAGERSRQ